MHVKFWQINLWQDLSKHANLFKFMFEFYIFSAYYGLNLHF